MIFNNFTKLSDCLKCRDCCRFTKEEINYAPVLTGHELAEIKKIYRKEIWVKSLNSKTPLFQFKLRKTDKQGRLVCQFFNGRSGLCSINDEKPFDCQLFPFLLLRKEGKIYVSCFNKKECLAVARVGKKQFNAHMRYVAGILKKNIKNRFPKDFSNFIWDYDPKIFSNVLLCKEIKI